MPTFGLIAEGVTDHVVLENILIGYFNDFDLVVRQLQPLRDATDELKGFGNWYNVFEYCKSSVFKDAFIQNDYFVIQIDTDCAHEKHYDVPPVHGESTEQFIERVIAKFEGLFRDSFGDEFYESHKERILFAIAVDEIECWLLPLYYNDNNRSSTKNCLFKLNREVAKKNKKLIIIPDNKDFDVYDKLSKPYMKQKMLNTSYPQNPSFNYFMEHYLQSIPQP